jgi:hypothetical protein
MDCSEPSLELQSTLHLTSNISLAVTSSMARRIVFVDRRVECKQVSAAFGGTHQSILIIQFPVVEDRAPLHYAKSFPDSSHGDLG